MNVQSIWNPTFRDVVILDPANERPVAAFNLTDLPLSVEANRTALKNLLLSVATLADSDGDLLCDYWEDTMFAGDRSPGRTDDWDRDHSPTLLEYVHGSHPNQPASQPRFTTDVVEVDGLHYPSVTFRRRLGAAGGLVTTVELSETLDSWVSGQEHLVEFARINPYDGTGTEIVTYRAAQAYSAFTGPVFLRPRSSLPPAP